MAIQINTPQTPRTRFSVILSGQTYSFLQTWNERSASWYLGITAGDGTIIRSCGKMLPRVPLVIRNKHLMPLGNLYIVAVLDANKEPVSRTNLGLDKDFVLTYILDSEAS